MINGVIISWHSNQGYGWVREQSAPSGNGYFFHISNCNIPEDEIKVGLYVTYELTDVNYKGHSTKNAINLAKM